jgi:hypothetical protein
MAKLSTRPLFLDTLFHQADELFQGKDYPEDENHEADSPDEPRQPVKSHRLSYS